MDYPPTLKPWIALMIKKFPLAPMGVLAPGSAHARPSAQPPINTSRNFSAHLSAKLPSNISPNPSEVISKVSEHKTKTTSGYQLVMTSEGFGEMCESDFADMCTENFSVDGGLSRGSSVRRPRSEDPHRRNRNLY